MFTILKNYDLELPLRVNYVFDIGGKKPTTPDYET